MLKKSMYGKADDLSYQSALVCDGLFPFCPANTYCFLANDILLSIHLLILFRVFFFKFHLDKTLSVVLPRSF